MAKYLIGYTVFYDYHIEVDADSEEEARDQFEKVAFSIEELEEKSNLSSKELSDVDVIKMDKKKVD